MPALQRVCFEWNTLLLVPLSGLCSGTVGTVVREPGTQTNVELLGLTQEYLRCELQRLAPDSLLVTAWDEFYWIYSGLLRRFAVAQGLRGTDVDDCLQEVWFEVAQSLNEFEHPQERSGLRAWLYAVVRSKATDIFRRNARRREESLDAARATGIEPQSPPSELAAQAQYEWERTLLETTVESLRGELSPTNAELLQLRLVEQREAAEVAVALQISVEQVWYRQYRLLKKVRARMAVFSGQAFGRTDAPGKAAGKGKPADLKPADLKPADWGRSESGQNSSDVFLERREFPKKNEKNAPRQLAGSVS